MAWPLWSAHRVLEWIQTRNMVPNQWLLQHERESPKCSKLPWIKIPHLRSFFILWKRCKCHEVNNFNGGDFNSWWVWTFRWSPFHDVAMFILVPDFLFKFIVAHCVLDYLLSYEYLKILSFFLSLNNLFKQWKVRTIFGNRMLF